MIQSKNKTLKFVAAVRLHLCSYDSPDGRCDCKFGAGNIGKMTERGPGCPEMAVVRAFLEAITPSEWTRIYNRIRKNKRTAFIVQGDDGFGARDLP